MFKKDFSLILKPLRLKVFISVLFRVAEYKNDKINLCKDYYYWAAMEKCTNWDQKSTRIYVTASLQNSICSGHLQYQCNGTEALNFSFQIQTKLLF